MAKVEIRWMTSKASVSGTPACLSWRRASSVDRAMTSTTRLREVPDGTSLRGRADRFCGLSGGIGHLPSLELSVPLDWHWLRDCFGASTGHGQTPEYGLPRCLWRAPHCTHPVSQARRLFPGGEAPRLDASCCDRPGSRNCPGTREY